MYNHLKTRLHDMNKITNDFQNIPIDLSKKVVYKFDDDDDDYDYDDFDKRKNRGDDATGCGCLRGLEIVCSYMTLSDDCFEKFTDHAMALTITLFRFVKVLDEFSVALELLLKSSHKIKALALG
jgi:hypothetical protein